MDKFLGILFFYSLAFNNQLDQFKLSYKVRGKYLESKSFRYLGFYISLKKWEILKEKLKDLPSPDTDRYLSNNDIIKLLETFDEVIGLKNIHYKLHMYGDPNEKETIDYIYNNLRDYISIIGGSNGVSITIGDWLSKTNYNRKLIDRYINLDLLNV